MALTQVSSKGIKDGTILNEDVNASADIAGSKLADNSISLAKLLHGDSNNNGKFLRANNGADPTFETVSTDLVGDTSPQLGGSLDVNDFNILNGTAILDITQNTRFEFNVGGSKYLDVNAGGIDVTGNITVTGTVDGVDIAAFKTSFDTKLANLVEDTTPQLGGNLDTNSHEISLDTSHAVNFGDSNELLIKYHGSHGQIIYTGNGSLQNKVKANSYFQIVNNDTGDNMLQAQAGGALSLWHAGNEKLQTLSDGVNIIGTLKVNGSAFSASGGLMGITVITSVGTSTWTKPSGCNSVRVIVTGGGGGAGGNGETSNDIGAAGGAGGTAIEFIDVSGVSSVSVTVGNYGTGGSGSSNGNAGSTSSYGSYCSATGGGAGIQGNFGANKGGAGGTGSGGDINITGGDGGNGYDNSGWSTQYGGTPHLGGASFWGGGANGGIHNAAPSAATTYGSGGAGGMRDNQSAGSRGMSGVVYIEEYT